MKDRRAIAQARLNLIRRHIPHSYWLAFDAVLAILLTYGLLWLSPVFAIGLVLLAISLVVDLAEFILKKQGAR